MTIDTLKRLLMFAVLCIVQVLVLNQIRLFGYACPLGLNTVVFPAVYGKDTMTGARMASISHIISIITIPLMYMIFVG